MSLCYIYLVEVVRNHGADYHHDYALDDSNFLSTHIFKLALFHYGKRKHLIPLQIYSTSKGKFWNQLFSKVFFMHENVKVAFFEIIRNCQK